MDITKWKSILVPIGIYHRIREFSQLEHRKIGQQLTLIFEEWLEYKHKEAAALDRREDSAPRDVDRDEDGSRRVGP
jgi:hypothetical protein